MSLSRSMRKIPELDDLRGWQKLFQDLRNDIGSVAPSSIEAIDPNSVLGNPTGAAASPVDIQATSDGHVLRLSGNLGFGTITSTSVSDFTAAARAAISVADTVSLDITYAAGQISADVLPAGVDHDLLLNFVADEHVAHTGVTLTAGAGLTGGGDISASRTFNVGAGTGITVNANDVAISTDGVDNTLLANMAQSTIKGRAEGAGTGDPTDLTATQVAAIIDQEAITWTGTQFNTATVTTGTGTSGVTTGAGATGRAIIRMIDSGGAADAKFTQWTTTATTVALQALTDNLVTSRAAYLFTRSAGAWTDLTFGNTTNNPTYTFVSTATATFSGQVTALRFVPTSSTAATNGLYLSAANTPAISSNSTLAMSWDSSQNALGKAAIRSDSATAGVGYATGAGGTVTQATSRTTGVTLNKVCGAITLVSAAGSASWQSFTVTNSAVAATDNVIVNQKSGTDLNMIHVTAVAAGSFQITFATTGGTTVEQPVFNFAVIKAVAA